MLVLSLPMCRGNCPQHKMTKHTKTAIITGGAKGIGAAISSKLADDGFSLHIAYHQSVDEFTKLSAELAEKNISLSSTRGDITDPETCGKIVSDCLANQGRIDAVILNAGHFTMSNIDNISPDEWNQLIHVNLSSAIFILNHAMEHLRKTGGNVIFIGTGSIANPIPAPDYPLYEASKAGLHVLMKSLSATEAEHGVRVNMVSPGMIDTGGFSDGAIEKFANQVPLKRLGNPDEVADAVGFLLSEKATYITGANLDVTGGWIRKF
jgi:NAD(P)-dependent dehydrogenase (short-subunit alcohol dehydrogenase family)